METVNQLNLKLCSMLVAAVESGIKQLQEGEKLWEIKDFLPIHLSRPLKIYIRESYRNLTESLKGNDTPVCLTGNPGTGKTYFAFYFLVWLLNGHHSVAYVRGKANYLFTKESNTVTCRQLCQLFDVVLYDVMKGNQTISMIKCKKQVFIYSPGSFNKDWCPDGRPPPYVMPTWTKEELRTIIPETFDLQIFEDNFAIFGGIPRYVCMANSSAEKRETLTKVDVFSIELLMEAIGDPTSICAEVKGFNRLFHLKVDPVDLQEFSVDYASDKVLDLISKRLDAMSEVSMASFIETSKDTPFMGVLRGRFFEEYAHRKLARGGSFQVK